MPSEAIGGLGSPGAGFTGSFEPLCMGAGTRGSLQEQFAFLTAELTFQLTLQLRNIFLSIG